MMDQVYGLMSFSLCVFLLLERSQRFAVLKLKCMIIDDCACNTSVSALCDCVEWDVKLYYTIPVLSVIVYFRW